MERQRNNFGSVSWTVRQPSRRPSKAFKMAGPVKQEQLVEALDAMHSERGKIAANPEYVPLMSSCGAKLDWSVSQYITQVTPMMSKYYLCRIF